MWCIRLEGDWSHPIHQPPLKETQNLDLSGSMDGSDNIEDSKSSSEFDHPQTGAPEQLNKVKMNGTENEEADLVVEKNKTKKSSVLSKGLGAENKLKPLAGTESSVAQHQQANGAESAKNCPSRSDNCVSAAMNGATEPENDEDEDSLDRTRESEEWKPKPSLSESLPEGRFLFIPPNRSTSLNN